MAAMFKHTNNTCTYTYIPPRPSHPPSNTLGNTFNCMCMCTYIYVCVYVYVYMYVYLYVNVYLYVYATPATKRNGCI